MSSYVRWRRAAGAAAVSVSISLGGASAARAASNPFHCEASALRAVAAGTGLPEPATAGRARDCGDYEALPDASVAGLPGVGGGALIARTEYDAALGAGTAVGGMGDLALSAPAGALPTQQAAAALAPVAVKLPDDLAKQLAPLGIPGTVSADVTKAVLALVPTAPPAINADALRATAEVSCEGGRPRLTGAADLANLRIGDAEVALDGPTTQALTLLDAQTIDPAALSRDRLGVITPLTGASPDQVRQVMDAVVGVVSGLPKIALPASVVDVTVVPKEQVRTASRLVEHALHATLSVAGTPILDAIVGEAVVSAATDDGACGAVAAQSTLGCSDRKLALLDVVRRGRHVTLIGAANRDYVGRRVAIRLRRTNRIVAHATVRRDGSFATTAPLPARRLMASHTKANSLRYRAEIGREKSLPLKLLRRLSVSALTSKHGLVTISGRVSGPLTTPVSPVRLVRRVSCHRVVLVKRFTPRPDGTFTVTVKAPKNQQAAVYRLATRVREQASNPRSYPTFTLPRGVDLQTR